MKKSQELAEQEAQKREALEAILGKEDGTVTTEEFTQAKALKAEIIELETQRVEAEEMEAFGAASKNTLATLNAPKPITHSTTSTKITATTAPKSFEFAGSFVKNFKGERHGKSAPERAYGFGRFILAAAGHQASLKWCSDNGIAVVKGGYDEATKAQVEGVNISGGYLVPEEFNTDMIDLREQYGVFRQNVRVVPMARDTMTIPRRAGGLTGYYVGENVAITESQMSWNQVRLTARKLAVLAKYSSELSEDSIINIGDVLAGEIAYAFANAEDNAGFNGDGTSTYGTIVGLSRSFLNLTTTIADIAGLYVGAGNLLSELTLADFNNTKAKLPQYAVMRGNCRWFVSQTVWSGTMERLALASGGVTSLEIVSGVNTPRFLGFPVVISQVLPVNDANSQIVAYLGDLNQAATMGDRRQTTIAFSEHLNFAEDEIAIRGTERYDINVHDVGNSSATASLRVPGPVVGLITAAS